jgi:hypothetical protein
LVVKLPEIKEFGCYANLPQRERIHMSKAPMFKAWDIRRKRMRVVREIKFFADGIRVDVAKREEDYEPLLNMSGYDPEFILLRHVGLEGENVKEAYEGSILKIPDLYETPENTEMTYHYEKITHSEGTFKVGGFPIGEDWDYLNEAAEVVGNIYENPGVVWV